MNQKGNIVIWAIISTAIIIGGGLGIKLLYPYEKPAITPQESAPEVWVPKPGTTFQLQFTGELDTTIEAEIYDIDLFDNSQETIQKLHDAGKRVVCYFSAGSWEDWRPDSNDFSKSVIGKDYTGWEGEKWLDIRQLDLIGPIMQKRIALAKEKGCDGIDPDNIDGYNNDTGFPLTPEDQLEFNIWLAKKAHQQGLSIGLKNNPEQATDLLSYYDWALTESCAAQNWCDQLEIFIKNDKAVFQIEYTDTKIDFNQACKDAQRRNFNVILKNRVLDAWVQTCERPVSALPNPPPIDKFVSQTISEARPEPEKASASTLTEDQLVLICPGAKLTQFECYENHFKNLVSQKGVGVAFTDLKRLYEINSYVKSQAHPLAHIIGQIASEKFPDVSEAYTQGDSFAWSGYYHGVLEGIIGKIGPENLPNQLKNICSDLASKNKYSFDHYNCVHGLGHGVMAHTDDELFKSLKLCDLLSDSWERTSCWSGAFMENIIIDNKNHFTNYLKPSDPLYPCNAVDKQYKDTCYLMQTSYMLKVTSGDFTKVFGLCEQVETEYQPTCYQSLGRDASGRSVSDIQITKTTCQLGKNFDQQKNCVIGAVKDFISYHHSDVQAKNLCAEFSEDLQSICMETAKSYYTVF